ncbi:MAG: hypothetical protein C0592_06690 [Marinilabiliales bacterium]|nr:MAG: hypothetical protein C0592_06690 [Marinilabiliales bacterium]
MAELKTKPNDKDPKEIIAAIENEDRRKDCEALLNLMSEYSGEKPVIWGDGIIGFGTWEYEYSSGRKGTWFRGGFANRKQAISLYLMGEMYKLEDISPEFGKFKTGKGCLYIKKLSDIKIDMLKDLLKSSFKSI